MPTTRSAVHHFLFATGAMITLLHLPAAQARTLDVHPPHHGREIGPPGHGAKYHVANRYTLGGDGGWDYVALDTASHRLFITRGDRAMVVDPANGKVLGEVTGIDGAHGVAFDYASGHGFATSGRDSSVVMFDLKTLAVSGRSRAAADADAILFDPATKHVFTFNGDAQSSSVIDGATGRNIGTVDLGAKPEFGVSDGHGKVYVNLESTGEIAEIDAAAMKVTRTWSIAPCQSPTGLAIDVAHDRLFSGCRNRVMAISDAKAGKLVTTVPIGSGVDACRFDAATGDAFSSNGGDGTITVVHEDAPDHFTVVQTVPTMRSARTMELNPTTHALYTVGAKFGPMPAQSAGTPRRRRPPMVPGSFTLLVLER
ncbi:MAG TPA: YncE family protein [Gemmatimonadaceae bacterium]